MNNPIKVEALVDADKELVYDAYTNPNHIVNWNFATPDWQCPWAKNDLREGGEYKAMMEAKDGSFSFEFGGVYSKVEPNKMLALTLDDGRKMQVDFKEEDDKTVVTTLFEADKENPEEMQQQGWQAILNNFKAYAESLKK